MPQGNLTYKRGEIRLVAVLEEEYWESIRLALNVVLGF